MQAVISHDSDMIALFQIPVQIRELCKNGSVNVYRFEDVIASKSCGLGRFTSGQLLVTCILAGCDMISSVKGVGMIKACELMSACKKSEKVHSRYSSMFSNTV